MSTRRESRTWAVQMLFQRDFNAGALEEDFVLFWSDRRATTKARTFTEDLVRGVETARAQLDGLIKKYADNWDLHRMGGVERNAMRVAVYEMLHRPDVPPVVSINEAVDLVKEMSTDEGGKFVNGILDRIRKDLKRPARAAAVVGRHGSVS